MTTTLTPEVTGLRRRFTLFGANTQKAQGPAISELRVVHDDGIERVVKPGDEYEEEDSLSQSESSSSSGASEGRADEVDPAASVNHRDEEEVEVAGVQNVMPSPLPRSSRPREASGSVRFDPRERRTRQRRSSSRVAHDSAAAAGRASSSCPACFGCFDTYAYYDRIDRMPIFGWYYTPIQ